MFIETMTQSPLQPSALAVPTLVPYGLMVKWPGNMRKTRTAGLSLLRLIPGSGCLILGESGIPFATFLKYYVTECEKLKSK